MTTHTKLWALGLATVLLSAAASKEYKTYPYDGRPIKTHRDLGSEWEKNKAEWQDKVAPSPVLKRQFELMAALSTREPKWIDGYWLGSDAAFQLGNSYSDPKDLGLARTAFERGKVFAETCLSIQAENPLCKFYLGVNMGKMASVDGIFASLRHAKKVETLWTDVVESPYNHRWSKAATLQGSGRYVLGLYYRLVPDFFLMKWLFGVKGDITKSVAMHRECIEFDGPNVCNKTMLGVALVCAGGKTFDSPDGKEGLRELQEARSYPVTSALYASCAKDLAALAADPRLSCGYETSRQQETSEADFKKQNGASGSAH